jgi:hypothetical protein
MWFVRNSQLPLGSFVGESYIQRVIGIIRRLWDEDHFGVSSFTALQFMMINVGIFRRKICLPADES